MNTASKLLISFNSRLRYVTRCGCRVEFDWCEEREMQQCTISPPPDVTSSQFRGLGTTVFSALLGAYKIAMEAGVFDPMTEGT